ncbi:MAG: iron-containing redox enzyme family protein, partial [Noviherbaspirillum sp.]
MPKTVRVPARPPSTESTAKELYAAFTAQDGVHDSASRQPVLRQSLAFLSEQLELARMLPCDLPSDPALLAGWLEQNTARVGQQYRDYLQARKAGGPRQYFSNKSHACYFLKSVAPTKMVDGAWLYGLLPRWNDARFAAMIGSYLEELGGGS